MGYGYRLVDVITKKIYPHGFTGIKKGGIRIKENYPDPSGEIIGHHYNKPQFSEAELIFLATPIQNDLEGILGKNDDVSLSELDDSGFYHLPKPKFHPTSEKAQMKYAKQAQDIAKGTGRIVVREIVARKNNRYPYLLVVSNGLLEEAPTKVIPLGSSKYFKVILEDNTSSVYIPTLTSLGDEFVTTKTDGLYALSANTVKKNQENQNQQSTEFINVIIEKPRGLSRIFGRKPKPSAKTT